MKNRIKELRKQKGLTLAELGELVNLSPSHIGNIENHRRGLDVEWIGKFSEALGVSPTEIMEDWLESESTEEVIIGIAKMDAFDFEMIQIWNGLSIKKKVKLMQYAYDLEKNDDVDK